MNRFEENIRKRRDELDIYEAPEGSWEKIRHSLDNKKIRPRRWIYAAAVFTIIAGSSLLLMRQRNTVNTGSEVIASANSKTGISAQLKESEIYYTTLLKNLYSRAEPLLAENPDIEKEFLSDMNRLDSIYADIRKDLKENVDNAEVVEALIRNYRIRISILEEMLSLLKDENNEVEKKESHEL